MGKGKILIVDDDVAFCKTEQVLLEEYDYAVHAVNKAEEAIPSLETGRFDIVLLDMKIGEDSGIDVLKEIKNFDPNIVVIMLTAFASMSLAVKAVKEGAYDYLQKDVSEEELLIKIEKSLEKRKYIDEISSLKGALSQRYGFTNIVGIHPKIKDIFNTIKTVCNTDVTILILGETGTGKELIAKAVHFNSRRSEKPFVELNCAAISENLMESELFGHEKGAFTDAHKQKPGLVEVANGGTLFLDEVGDMSVNLQAKLLRFLQDKSFNRVGGTEKLTSDVRVIAATNKYLLQMIKENKFREDLYYRLNIVRIEVPPLRERMDDFHLLAEYFIKKANIKFNKRVKSLEKQAMQKLSSYNWPGNVRELEGLIDRLVLFSEDKEVIEAGSITDALTPSETIAPGREIRTDLPLREARDEFEKAYLTELLKQFNGNIDQVTQKSKMTKKNISIKMKKYNLNEETFKLTLSPKSDIIANK